MHIRSMYYIASCFSVRPTRRFWPHRATISGWCSQQTWGRGTRTRSTWRGWRPLGSATSSSEFYRYSRQLRQEVDPALSYFHDVNQQPLVETRSNRIRSVRPQTAVFRGMIGHSMVNSKILLLQRPKVSARLSVLRRPRLSRSASTRYAAQLWSLSLFT